MPPAYVTQTSRGLVVGSQDDLVETFWCGEGVRAQVFRKILNGGRLSLLGEGRCAARHGGSWGPKTGRVGICGRSRKVVARRGVLDVLLGGLARFGHVNVLNDGRTLSLNGSGGKIRVIGLVG